MNANLHPLAQILLDHKERVMAESLRQYAPEEDQHIFEESLWLYISYTQEVEGLSWKNILGDGDADQYCWRVRYDYDDIYRGAWVYGCTRYEGMYHDPTKPRPKFELTPNGDEEQMKKDWKVYRRRLTGNNQ